MMDVHTRVTWQVGGVAATTRAGLESARLHLSSSSPVNGLRVYFGAG